jgi:putative endonuclease
MEQFTVYILQCKDNSLYVGVTNNIERRLYEHNFGEDETTYTYRRRPAYLVYYAHFPDPMQAIAFEKKLKGWSRKKKVALIKQDWEKLHELASCRNYTSSKFYDPEGEASQNPID